MSAINDGGPAFATPGIPMVIGGLPVNPWDGHGWMVEPQSGMTLRDWLASQEIISDAEDVTMGFAEALAGPRPKCSSTTNPLEWLLWESKWRAVMRYTRADAMIAARAGKEDA